ncbi:hypothetical protein [Metallosphaera hakonensis]|uniref:Uncharacterized protein n=1 Tax=Metallosphaera hakonensis JCM 8857 = DSM 7519 TaxID=1293036 RepID=A0A2U9IWX7_9CREN|nr:hypothetical protein [Metallosphaera hakonensis]AWS00406.1 hypothetical protein DFR87_12800 [Metallosphaera hakonensis JCM 8857 = DSM 7519]
MRIGTLILALGIAVLALGTVSIDALVSFTITLSSHPLQLEFPPTAKGFVTVSENATNTTVYVLIIHDGEHLVKLPFSSPLSPGNWTIVKYKEIVTSVNKVVIAENETLKCGNVTTQKVVNQVVESSSYNVTVPVYVHVKVNKMGLVQNPNWVEVVGGVLMALGSTLAFLERRLS